VGLLPKTAESLKTLNLTNNSLVVTGHRAPEVAALAESFGLKTVHNAGFTQGMASSILTGLEAAADGPVMILPVDAALVSPQSILAVIGLFRSLTPKDQDAALIIPTHKGRCGHPPLLGPNLRKKILELKPTNLRVFLSGLLDPSWVSRYQEGLAPLDPPTNGPIRFVERPDVGVLTDIDTPTDYEASLNLPVTLAPWPNPWDLFALLELVGPGQRVIRHSLGVAKGALRLSRSLKDKLGPQLVNPLLGFLGGLIHDVDRLEKKHEAQGEARLRAIGYPRLGRLVGQHKDLTWPPAANDWDLRDLYGAMALYLADKYLIETEFVSLSERFATKIDSFDNPKAKSKGQARLANALKVETWFRNKLGQEPGAVCHQRTLDPLEELADKLASEV
jgi:CTP:molybdopterin cytidylyltransferase MocA